MRHLTLTFFFAFANVALAGKPNIIFIMVDDLDKDWISCYGADNIQTPHIDKWAANLAKVPVFAFAGGKDRVVRAERSERMIAAIKKAGGKEAKIQIYPNEGHGAGRVVFGSAEFYEWMFSKKQDSAQ